MAYLTVINLHTIFVLLVNVFATLGPPPCARQVKVKNVADTL